jgi:hypothetical protein
MKERNHLSQKKQIMFMMKKNNSNMALPLNINLLSLSRFVKFFYTIFIFWWTKFDERKIIFCIYLYFPLLLLHSQSAKKKKIAFFKLFSTRSVYASGVIFIQLLRVFVQSKITICGGLLVRQLVRCLSWKKLFPTPPKTTIKTDFLLFNVKQKYAKKF